MQKKRLVVLTGAGISADSGLKTFRDSDGLWEGYDIYEVATPEAWKKDYKKVQGFYNARRSQIINSEPNKAHVLLARLEQYFDVCIITQNIDDLHERAGSKNIMHLHGNIRYGQSVVDSALLYRLEGSSINDTDLCEHNKILRPFVVWFGEPVPMMQSAMELCATADVFLIVGTSLAVYPAASLVDFVPGHAPKYIIDPNIILSKSIENYIHIQEQASKGMIKLLNYFNLKLS